MTTVGVAFPGELARCVALLKRYDDRDPVGLFGKAMLEAQIRVAVQLWESGGPVKQAQAFAMLKDLKD